MTQFLRGCFWLVVIIHAVGLWSYAIQRYNIPALFCPDGMTSGYQWRYDDNGKLVSKRTCFPAGPVTARYVRLPDGRIVKEKP